MQVFAGSHQWWIYGEGTRGTVSPTLSRKNVENLPVASASHQVHPRTSYTYYSEIIYYNILY